MHKSLFTLITLVAILFISFNNAHAQQEIYAVDLSSDMGNKAIEMAKQEIEHRLNVSKKHVGLVGFTDRVQVSLPPGEFTPESLAELSIKNSPASLEVGLQGAMSLFEGDDPALVVFYTSGSKDSCQQFFRQLSQVLNHPLEIEVNLYRNNLFQPPFRISLSSTTALSPPPGVLKNVRNYLAKKLGVHDEAIQMNSNLASDFGIGQIEAYELFISLCEHLNVRSPQGDTPVIISDIVNYIEENSFDKQLANDANQSGDLLQGRITEAPEINALAEKDADGLYVQQIFYGTNRQPTGEKNLENYFGGERSEGDPIRYGTCNVSIPAQHKRGAVESPFLGLELFADPQKHIRIRSVTPMSDSDFFKRLRKSVNKKDKIDAWSNDLVVFVHGFNVTFAEGAKRTAQIAFDFGFSGAPVMFSWPSDGQLFGYTSDREDATWSIMHIEQFLQDVRKKANPERMHLVAHSMGNQGLIGALNRIALKKEFKSKPLFESITLAAPDFDAQLFQQQIAPGVVSLANYWTIYTSDNDAALNVSTKVNNTKRLGLPVTPIEGIAVIDATGIEVTPWSVPEFHSYYATKQPVIEDIVAAIKGVAPKMRDLLPKSKNGIPYWKLKGIK